MPTLPTHFNPLPRRLASALAGLALGIVLFLCVVTSASANSYLPRTYESQLAAGQPEPLAIDSANRIWVDPCSGGCGLPISEFNPLGERPPVQIFGGSRIEGSIAADHSNDVLYVPDTYQSTVSAYSATGPLFPKRLSSGKVTWRSPPTTRCCQTTRLAPPPAAFISRAARLKVVNHRISWNCSVKAGNLRLSPL